MSCRDAPTPTMGDPRQGSTDAGVRGAAGSSTVAGSDTETVVSVGERSAGPFKPSIELLVDTALAGVDVDVDGTVGRCSALSFIPLPEQPPTRRINAAIRIAGSGRRMVPTYGSLLVRGQIVMKGGDWETPLGCRGEALPSAPRAVGVPQSSRGLSGHGQLISSAADRCWDTGW